MRLVPFLAEVVCVLVFIAGSNLVRSHWKEKKKINTVSFFFFRPFVVIQLFYVLLEKKIPQRPDLI